MISPACRRSRQSAGNRPLRSAAAAGGGLDLAAAQPGGFLEPALGALDRLLLAVLGAHAAALDVAAVRLHVPGAALVGELGVEDVAQLGPKPAVLDRDQDLDALLDVALHRVGRADVVLGPAAVVEVVDPLVLEEPADDADDLDRAGHAVEAGAQPAGVADDEVDGDAALRRAVQRAD